MALSYGIQLSAKGKNIPCPQSPNCPAHFALLGLYYAFGFDQNSNDYKVV